MYQIKCLIEGLTPLRMSKYNTIADNSTRGKHTPEMLDADAERRAYKDDRGYFVPGVNVHTSIAAGGKKVKYGKGTIGRQLKAIIFVQGNIYLPKKAKHEIVEGLATINKIKVPKRWVTFPEWELEFTINVLDDRFPENAIKDAINIAGLYEGLCDYRPTFGKYTLKKFEVK